MSLQDYVMSKELEEVRKDPSSLGLPYQPWIGDHDCQEYTYQEFGKVAEAIRHGKQYVPHNIPGEGMAFIERYFKQA